MTLSYRTAMTSQASLALMKWLSHLSRRLGVGKHVYVVGGAVRNFVIDKPIKDIDVVLDAIALGRDSEWFAREIMKALPAKTKLETNNYGVALLAIVGDWFLGGENLKGEMIEIANARTESYGEGGYKPDKVEPATIKQDVYRRDFTFNSLLWRLHDLADGPDKAEILDLSGCGLKDLQEGVMKCPSSPDKTFSDDPSRMVRAVKFFVKYGFKIAPELKRSIWKNRAKLKNIPHGALSALLLNTFLKEPTGKKALIALDDLGLLDVIKEIVQEKKAFREALANFADREAKIEFIFDLMDLGLPSGKRLSFLNKKQQERVREVTVGLSAAASDAYVKVLHQPGKVMDTRKLMQELQIQGRAVGQLSLMARDLLLEEPTLAADKVGLTMAVLRRYQRQRTAKTFKLEIGDPLLTGKYFNSPGNIEGFGTSDKGDPTVIVRKKPKGGRGQGAKKEVKLFKVRYDKSREKEAACRIACRWVSAGRPIPLDRKLIKALNQRVWAQLQEIHDSLSEEDRFKPLHQVLTDNTFFLQTVQLVDVRGEKVLVWFWLKGIKQGHGFWPGSHVTLKGGEKIKLTLKFNLNKTMAGFMGRKRKSLEWDSHSILTHEVTHLRDVIWPSKVVTVNVPRQDQKTDAYYNSPVEVRAYGQQIVAEILEDFEQSVKLSGVLNLTHRVVQRAMRNSVQFLQIKDHLTSDTRKHLQKMVAQALTEAAPRLRELYVEDLGPAPFSPYQRWEQRQFRKAAGDGMTPEAAKRVAHRYVQAARSPLFEAPGAKAKYKVQSNGNAVAVTVYYGRKRIGVMNAFPLRYPETQEACSADVWALLERYPQVEDTTRERWVQWAGEAPRTNTRALRVYKAFITDETKQGLGIGKAMYLAIMREWFAKVGPFLFMPMACSGSGTSKAALRVWKSLARDYPSSGNVIAVLRAPSPPSNMKQAGYRSQLETRIEALNQEHGREMRVFTQASSKGGVVKIIEGRKTVGHVSAASTDLQGSSLDDFWMEQVQLGIPRPTRGRRRRATYSGDQCLQDYASLAASNPKVKGLWYVGGAHIDKSFQGIGLGKLMYAEVIAQAAQVGCAVGPDVCKGESTSAAAFRVWGSLTRHFPHKGLVVWGGSGTRGRLGSKYLASSPLITPAYLDKLIHAVTSDPTGWGSSSPAARVLSRWKRSLANEFPGFEPFPVSDLLVALEDRGIPEEELELIRGVRPPRPPRKRKTPSFYEAHTALGRLTGKSIVFRGLDVSPDSDHLAPEVLKWAKAISGLKGAAKSLWVSEVQKIVLAGSSRGSEDASWESGNMVLVLGKQARSNIAGFRLILIHELGHGLEDKLGLRVTAWDSTPYGQPPFVSAYAGTNASEDFAETFRAAMTEARNLQRTAPAKYRDMRLRLKGRIAKSKFQKKKEVPKAKGKGTTTVYEYSKGQIQHRNREKAKKVEKLRGSIGKLRTKYRKDLTSSDTDTRYRALAVALMDCTFERVGNSQSAKDGHFGVTGWQAKHVKFSGNKATISYVGKSGVKQKKEVTDKSVVSALKAAMKGKSGTDQLCSDEDCQVTASEVNEYLDTFGITAKDVRGYHANAEVQDRLKAVRSRGGKLPSDKKERETKLKAEFNSALEEAAKAVGHESSTLKSQYLVPGLMDSYLRDGSVIEKLDKQGRVAFSIQVEDHGNYVEVTGQGGELGAKKRGRGLYVSDSEVYPKWRGKGHGVRLYMALADWAAENGFDLYSDITVETPAVHVWEALARRGYQVKRHPDAQQLTEKGGVGLFVNVPGNAPVFSLKRASFLVATKSDAQVEDEEARRILRRNPKHKPPRKDLQRNRMKSKDDNQEKGMGADGDRDLSLNYKRIARIAKRWVIAKAEVEHEPGKPFRGENNGWVGKNPGGATHTYGEDNEGYEKAVAFSKGLSNDGGDVEEALKDEKKQEKKQQKKKEQDEANQKFTEDLNFVLDTVRVPRRIQKSVETLLGADRKTDPSRKKKPKKKPEKKPKKNPKKKPKKKPEKKPKKKPEEETSESEEETSGSEEETSGSEEEKKLKLDRKALFDAFEREKASYLDQMSGLGMTAKSMEDLAKDPFKGVDTKDSVAVGEALVRSLFRERVLMNPGMVGGKALSSKKLNAEALAERAQEALEQYSNATPKIRQEVAQNAANMLHSMDPQSAQAVELNKIVDGLHLAALVAGDKDFHVTTSDGVLIRNPAPAQMGLLARKLQDTGQHFMLMDNMANEYGPKQRDALQFVMEDLDDDELHEMSKDTPWAPLTELLGKDAKDMSGRPITPEVKAYLRRLAIEMGMDGMTTIHGLVGAHSTEVDPQVAFREVEEKIRLGAAKRVKSAVSQWMASLKDAKSNLDWGWGAEAVRREQFLGALEAAAAFDFKPDPQNTAVALSKHIAEGGGFEFLKTKVVKAPPKAQGDSPLLQRQKALLKGVPISNPEEHKRVFHMTEEEVEAEEAKQKKNPRPKPKLSLIDRKKKLLEGVPTTNQKEVMRITRMTEEELEEEERKRTPPR